VEVIIAVTFVGFLTGFVAVLCVGNYFRAKKAMERQRQRRLARLAGGGGGGNGGLVDSPRSQYSGTSSTYSDHQDRVPLHPNRQQQQQQQQQHGQQHARARQNSDAYSASQPDFLSMPSENHGTKTLNYPTQQLNSTRRRPDQLPKQHPYGDKNEVLLDISGARKGPSSDVMSI